MPRDGSGVYSKPSGTTAVPNTTIESAKFNSVVDDLVTDANAARPITAGGTGATSASTARTALGLDTLFAGKVDASGGTMTADPTVALGVATKQYVDRIQGRNPIINGDMRVAQLGTTFTTPASGSRTLDNWQTFWTGAAPASVTRVSGPSGFPFAMRVTGAVGNTGTVVSQRMEAIDVGHMVGAPAVIQANISASVGQTFTWALFHATASDNFTSTTLISSGTWTVTTTATTYTAAVSNIPAGGANGLQLNIQPANGGAYTSGTFDITGVQIDKGTVATAFEVLPYPVQEARAQRTLRAYVDPPLRGVASATTTAGRMAMGLGVPMRIAPTASWAGFPTVFDGTASQAVTSIAATYSKSTHIEFDMAVAGGLTVGRAVVAYQVANAVLTLRADL